VADALPLWIIAAALGAFLFVCLVGGRIPGRGRGAGLDRGRNPTAFWLAMGLLGSVCAAALALAVRASL